jgi:hypothetical protein
MSALQWSGSFPSRTAEIPAVSEVEAGGLDESAIGADAFEQRDQLELADRRAARDGVEVSAVAQTLIPDPLVATAETSAPATRSARRRRHGPAHQAPGPPGR